MLGWSHRLIRGMIALTLLVSMWGSDFALSASAREGILALPPDRQLVDRTVGVWDQQPASAR